MKVLIVGGGPAGCIAALALSEKGVEVEIVELQTEFNAVGIGINLQNSPLRALNQIGLVDEIVEMGFSVDAIHMLNSNGDPIAPPIVNQSFIPGKPAGVQIGRGAFASLIGQKVLAKGIKVYFGQTVTELVDTGNKVEAVFSDESIRDYDFVIGADGINSKVRAMVYGENAYTSKYSGQIIWRAEAPRGTANSFNIYNAPGKKIGVIPISKTRLYTFLVMNSPEEPHRGSSEHELTAMRDQMEGFGGQIPELMDAIEHPVDIRALKSLFVSENWYRGRILLIGDAAHACTPHLAYGLGIAVEDGIVLAELFETHSGDLEKILPAFMERRYTRCLEVVRASEQLGAWEVHPPEDRQDYQNLMTNTYKRLSEPI